MICVFVLSAKGLTMQDVMHVGGIEYYSQVMISICYARYVLSKVKSSVQNVANQCLLVTVSHVRPATGKGCLINVPTLIAPHLRHLKWKFILGSLLLGSA